jgi:hypothetical protein
MQKQKTFSAIGSKHQKLHSDCESAVFVGAINAASSTVRGALYIVLAKSRKSFLHRWQSVNTKIG